MNIRLRLTLWYTLILFLILGVFSLIIYVGLEQNLMVAIDNHLQREAVSIINTLQKEARHDDDEDEEDHEEGEQNKKERLHLELDGWSDETLVLRVLNHQGQPLLTPSNFDKVKGATPRRDAASQAYFDYISLADKTPMRLYSVPFRLRPQELLVLQVAESYRHIQEVQTQLFFLLAVTIPLTLVIASFGGWFLASRALAPIDRITSAAQAISAYDLHQRLNLRLPNDELGRLATTFDHMLARLDEAFTRQKRFIADASHEMRTPLTILKGDVEVALMRPRSVSEYQETLTMIDQMLNRLTALVEELLLLARAENHQVGLQQEHVNLSELLGEVVDSLESVAQRRQMSLTLEVPAGLVIQADYGKLTRLFINLIENALKYSAPGDPILIRADTRGEWQLIEIIDHGPGIAPEHLPHLFERFYRVDKARSRQINADEASSGSGLGLSIAEWVATVHGGRITVESQLGQGTTFQVWLPR